MLICWIGYIRFFFTTEARITSQHKEICFPSLQTFRQHSFIKEEFHSLNVPRVGEITAYDIFDCTFECLNIPSCLSFNVAAPKGPDGKFSCVLLSSDKYCNSENYEESQSWHHFAIKVQICPEIYANKMQALYN